MPKRAELLRLFDQKLLAALTALADGVFLGLNYIPVPALYGPSGGEGDM